ncbi:MAG: CaiB/BaiF CoA transferase family protein [Bacteroidia bacterium]
MPLQNIKVIELAGVLAGPSAGMFLAELGAEVIKIENPATNGDVTRGWKLPDEEPLDQITTYFSCANWGKRSLAVNINSDEGKDVIYKLLQDADIVITSYKKGDDAKLGMDYETLKAFSPNLIYASISGYGEDEDRIAYDAVLQAECGFMFMNGTPESGPLKFPVAIIDLFAAHQLKEAILLAIINRYKTGEGSKVNISLWQSALSALANQATNYLMENHIAELEGSEHPNIAPYGDTFKTKDERNILLAVGSNKQFETFCHILGIGKILHDERFTDNKARLKNREALKAFLAEAIYGWNSAELVSELKNKNVPSGLVQSIAEAMERASPEFIHHENNFKAVSQLAFSSGKKQNVAKPPYFGEHTAEILKEKLHFTEAEIEDLRAKKVIV